MQFLLWFTFGTFGIFYVAYLKELGYSSKFIALGLTLSTLSGIGAQYFWGYMSDLTSRIKTIFLGLLVALITVVMVFPFAVGHPSTTIIFMVFFGITWMPLEALLDSWILSSDDLPNSNYGTIRAGGSLGFALITLVFGGLIVRYGFDISLVAFAVSGLSLFIIALTTKTRTSKVPTPMNLDQVRQLLSNPLYTSMLIFSTLIFINYMGINNFYIYVVKGVGGDEGLIGMAASAAAFIEIFGFLIGAHLQKRFGPLMIMTVVAFGSFGRIVFLAGATSYVGVLLTAALQGLMFSLFMGTFKLYIIKVTPIALLTTAQTLGASTYFGVSSIIANIFGGIMIDDYGMKIFYRFLVTMSVLAVLYVLVLYRVEKIQSSKLLSEHPSN